MEKVYKKEPRAWSFEMPRGCNNNINNSITTDISGKSDGQRKIIPIIIKWINELTKNKQQQNHEQKNSYMSLYYKL